MIAQTLISTAFFVISLIGLLIHSYITWNLRRAPHWMSRTAICRFLCAIIYVFIGANAIWFHWFTLYISLLAFTATQTTWIVNASMDKSLSQKIGEKELQ